MSGLLDDFEASRPGLESRLLLAQRMAAGTGHLLDLLDPGTAATSVAVPGSLVLAVLGGPTYEPNTNTLDAALASGEVGLLSNDELRAELTTWRRTLADATEDEREVRRITNEQLVPLLARSINLGPYFENLVAWSGGDPYASGRLIDERRAVSSRSPISIALSTELTGALALREFYVEFSAADLRDLLASLDRVVALLETELRRYSAAGINPSRRRPS